VKKYKTLERLGGRRVLKGTVEEGEKNPGKY